MQIDYLQSPAQVKDICRKYNITYKKLSTYLKEIGHGQIGKNATIQEAQTLKRIYDHFKEGKKEKASVRKFEKEQKIHPKEVEQQGWFQPSKVETQKKFIRIGGVSIEVPEGHISNISTFKPTPKLKTKPEVRQPRPIRQSVPKEFTSQMAQPQESLLSSRTSSKEEAFKFNNLEGNHSNERVLNLDENLFFKIKKIVEYKNLPVIKSHFSDVEAVTLCKKLICPFTRRLCKEFEKGINKQEVKYQLHHIANKALQLYKGPALTFYYRLPPINFKHQMAVEVSTYRNVQPEFPIFTLKTNSTSFSISFFVGRIKGTNKTKAVIRVFEPKTHKPIVQLDSAGYILKRLEGYTPRLSLFYQESVSNGYHIFSGVTMGECEICGKPLKDPKSLRIGIGPGCAKNFNIRTDFYNY